MAVHPSGLLTHKDYIKGRQVSGREYLYGAAERTEAAVITILCSTIQQETAVNGN
jgi:hypothetical protein